MLRHYGSIEAGPFFFSPGMRRDDLPRDRRHCIAQAGLAYADRMMGVNKSVSGWVRLLALVCLLATLPAAPLSAQVTAPHQAEVEIRTPAPPRPTIGSDWARHLGYELHVTNFYAGTGALRLKRVSIFADRATIPIATFSGAALRALLSPNGDDPPGTGDIVIAGGARVVLFVWLTEPASAPRAAYLRHSVEFETKDGKVEVANDVRVAIDNRPPVRIGPPLTGGPWLAGEGPGNHMSHHWGGVVAIDGQVTIPQRFAIDWFGLDATGHVARVPRDRLAASSDADWVGFGADVLAVGDGVVRDARDGVADGTPLAPQSQPDDLTSRSLYGNFVVIEIAPGVFAHYAHLRNGSVKVHAGDRVRRGAVIGALGQTGQAGGPHLHFHISDRMTFEGSEGLPFVIDGVTRLGSAGIDDTLDPRIKVNVGKARPEKAPSWLPLDGDLVTFVRQGPDSAPPRRRRGVAQHQ